MIQFVLISKNGADSIADGHVEELFVTVSQKAAIKHVQNSYDAAVAAADGPVVKFLLIRLRSGAELPDHADFDSNQGYIAELLTLSSHSQWVLFEEVAQDIPF